MTPDTLPNDFLSRMKALLYEEFDAFCQSCGQAAFHGIFLNTLAGPSDALLELLSQNGLTAGDPVAWEQNGFYYDEALPFGKHCLHEGGFYYIQEPSAMAPVALLDPRPGERVLDLCASPGGKTTQIGVRLKGSGLLVSNEIHPQRAAVLSENVERMGLSNVIVTNAAPDALSARFPLFFDRILVDAPCSGEGMFRKNPEAALQWSCENVQLCRDRQEMILSHADLMLSPGGYLAYSTCTFSREENEDMILHFLNTHPQYEACHLSPCGGMVYGLCSDHRDAMVRLFPHLVRGEGHFAALLRKKEGPKAASFASGQKKKKISSVKEDLSPVYEVLPALLSDTPKTPAAMRLKALLADWTCAGEDLFFLGSQLYLLPDPSVKPLVSSLKLLRPGLHLGTLEKGRFQPSLSLARALSVYDINNYVNLSADSEQDRRLLASYFEGNTFPFEGEKGWYLIAMAGRGMGWGKLAGGIMKNHYPKGLRKRLLF